MTETIRALDFDGVASIIDELSTAVFDEPHYWHAGTVAPQRDWEDLLEMADSMVGLGRLGHDAATLEGFDDELLEDLPDRFTDEIPIETDGDVKRYGDWQYPAWSFADPDTTADIRRADTQFAALTAFPESVLETQDHRLLTAGECLDRVEAVADHYGDEYAVLTGAFSPPGGGFSIQDARSVHQIGMTKYPAGLFADDGIGPVKSAKTTLHGALIIHRTDLAERTLQLIDGEAAEACPPGADEEDEDGDSQ